MHNTANPATMNLSNMTKDLLLDFLREGGVEEAVITLLSEQIKTIALKPNQALVSPGQVNTHLYYVLSGGFVCRFVDTYSDVERTINFYMNELHPFMACIDSFFTQTKTQCELRAFAQSSVLAISKKALDRLIEEHVQIKLIFDTLVTNALIEENDLKLKIIAYKPDVLYQYLIKNFPVIIQKAPSKYIAELMGISAEWLSKLKTRPRTGS